MPTQAISGARGHLHQVSLAGRTTEQRCRRPRPTVEPCRPGRVRDAGRTRAGGRAAVAAPGGHVAGARRRSGARDVSVFFFHALWRTPALEPLRPVLGHADIGVEVFFILSGFLVTRPLVAHAVLGGRARSGAVDFWRKRVARIWPAYLVALVGSVAHRRGHHRRPRRLAQARAAPRQLVRRRRRHGPARVVDARRGGRLLRC